MNSYRASGATCGSTVYPPSAALAWSSQLAAAATAHSTDMASNNFMSHTGSNGSSMAQRVDATGYAWSALAENIAGGQVSVSAVMSAWMSSSGHCHNIMNPNLQHIGGACMQNPDAQYTRYWTMVLGRPR